jgi:hypothetical protein
MAVQAEVACYCSTTTRPGHSQVAGVQEGATGVGDEAEKSQH